MPLLSTRGSVSDFALGFFKSGAGKVTSWVLNAIYSIGLTNDSVTDSTGNTYWCICRSSGTFIMKTSVTGSLIWSKQIYDGGAGYFGKTYVALDNTQTTLWLCQETTRANGANYVTELRSISTSSGDITAQGKYYYSSVYGRAESMQFSNFATDGKKIVITLSSKALRIYPNVMGTVILLVDPTNLASYRYLGTFCPGTTTSFYSYALGGAITADGNIVVACQTNSGYCLKLVDNLGNNLGTFATPSGNKISSVYANSDYIYTDWIPANGSIGIAQYQNAGTRVWATAAVITGATVTSPYSNVKTVWTDSSGNIYTACGVQNSTGNIYVIVLKVNSSGTIQWVKKIAFSLGDAYSSSVSGSAGYVTVACRYGPNPYAMNMTLKDDASNVDGTYTSTNGGTITISTPAYTVNTSFTAVGIGLNKYEQAPPSTPVSISGVTSEPGTEITTTLLPYT